MFEVEGVEVEVRYRPFEDEDTGVWGVDTLEINKKVGVVTVTRELPLDRMAMTIDLLSMPTKEEAELLKQEYQMDNMYDIKEMTTEDINRFCYNYIKNQDEKGFVYVEPLGVWTHTDYMESKEFETGTLAYVSSEMVRRRNSNVGGVYYPFECESDIDHCHSFEEILRLCAKCSTFKPLETEHYYSPMQLDLMRAIRREQYDTAWDD